MITYRKGLKYQIVGEAYIAQTPITGYDIDIPWIRLRPDGLLRLDVGYGWDGSSGPTWDGSHDMQASAEHDAFYRLIRLGYIPCEEKAKIDQRYRDKILEDTKYRNWFGKKWALLLAKLRHWGLKNWGEPHTRPSRRQRIYYAP